MMDRRQLFDDFSQRVDQIMEHQDEISLLRFDARLKNGTRFSFDYDSERFDKASRPARPAGGRHPVSVSDAVVDMIASLVTLNLLIVSSARFVTLSEGTFACVLLTYVSFFVFFTTSAVYHLFDEGHARTVKVLSMVRMGSPSPSSSSSPPSRYSSRPCPHEAASGPPRWPIVWPILPRSPSWSRMHTASRSSSWAW